MLRIEKLFLQGFKSFCDPTEVVFDKEGITAVVGPNGCGKSNIADGLSWVIGEQRAKALRGGKMEDVIFQGSRNRQPSGMAEITLTLVVHKSFEIQGEASQPETEALRQAEASLEQADAAIEASTAEADEPADEIKAVQPVEGATAPETADGSNIQPSQPSQSAKKRRRHTIPGTSRVFHEGERITIGRRLYRTGESEYEMDGRACRLRDIQDLFAGTGLGGAHYAIIEQGRIGQVLSAKPMDRRALIEEAAGISKFKMRQHTAEVKLEASKQNLSRVTDILAEIERQQNSLKRQAARVRRYQRLKQESRDLMRAVFLLDYRASNTTLTNLETALSQVTARESEVAASIAGLEEDQGKAAQDARFAESALNDCRQIAAKTDLEVDRARQQHAYMSEQLQSLGRRSAQFAQDQASITERRHLIDQETTRLREELHKLESEINSESKTLAEAEDEYRLRLEKDAESESKLEEARKKVYESVTHFERWRQLKRQFTDTVDRSQARLSGLSSEGQRAAAQALAAREQHTGVTEELEETSHKQARISSELSEISDTLIELRQKRESCQNNLSVLQHDLTATEHRLMSLNELDQQRAYFSESVQALMNHSLNGFKTLGTLADFVQVAPEHETMIETAMRDELQYVVVPTFDDALNAIEFLKTEGAGRATFLVLGLHGSEPVEFIQNGDGHPSRYQTLGTALGLRAEFADAFSLALPGLAAARIVADAALAIDESRLSNGGANGDVDVDADGGDEYNSGEVGDFGAGVVNQVEEDNGDEETWEYLPPLPPLPFSNSNNGGNGDNGDNRGNGGNSEKRGSKGGHEIASDTVLTLSGERIVAGRLITGGSRSERGIGVLALKREISELSERLEALAESRLAAESDLGLLKSLIAELEGSERQLDEEARRIDKKLAILREQLQQCEREIERTSTHIRVVEGEALQAEEELRESETKLQQATSQTEEAAQLRAEAEKVVEVAQAEIAELRRDAEQRLQELSRRRAEFATKTERRRGFQNDIRRLDNEASDLENRLGRSRMEAVEADEQTSSIQASIQNLAEQLQKIIADQQIHSEELGQRTAALATARERLESIDLKLRSARDAATQSREERAQKEIEMARLSSDLEHLKHSCQTELGENIVEVDERLAAGASEPVSDQTSEQPDPAAEQFPESDTDREDSEEFGEIEVSFWNIPEDFNLEAARKRLDELRAKIDGLGPVNMMALEELTEIEERYIFLITQKEDIEKAIADTQAAIAEIKRRSRERFVEAFHAINEYFKQMFEELFGGGHGEMRLIDETDVLESGIEIIAQPPGKRLQNVLLLSGGEKAMTALSLVMSIFKYRPSPFCLLDEVDAPLDDVNIGRFADKILEMSANTQFMVITHSKRTMEAAKVLYGVTMEDPGVSKLLSVKLA
jgi:chromosome segregation protein